MNPTHVIYHTELDTFNMTRKCTTEEFKAKVIVKFGDKFDLSRVDYKGSRERIEVGCKEHGFLWRAAYRVLENGCSKCNSYKGHRNRASTPDEFKEKVRDLHGDRFDLSRVAYVNYTTEVEIGCKEHGFFWFLPSNLLNHRCKYPCPECSKDLGPTSIEFTKQVSNYTFFSFEDEFPYLPPDVVVSEDEPKKSFPEDGFFCFDKEFPDSDIPPLVLRDHPTKDIFPWYAYYDTPEGADSIPPSPTMLYYILITDVDGTLYWKIGITCWSVNQRFSGITKHIEVLWTKVFDSTNEAYAMEQYFLNKFYEFRPFKHIERLKKVAGHTECFTKDVLPKYEI